MKIAKVMAMMKRGKCIRISRKGYPKGAVDDVDPDSGYGPQWISNGRAAYNLEGTSLIESAGQFYRAYDVDEKQQEKFFFKFGDVPDTLDLTVHRRWEEGAISARPIGITLGALQRVLKAFKYGDRIMFIDTAYLSPFVGEDNDLLEYEVKSDKDGRNYLCVLDGMMIAAVIYPVEFSENDESIEVYEALAACREEILRQRAANGKEVPAQAQRLEGQESLFDEEMNDEPGGSEE